MEPFRIKRLRIWNTREHQRLENVEFQFSDDVVLSDFPFVTLVIGANTTGKSRLLRIILDILNDLYNLKNEQRDSFAFKGGYNFTYTYQGKEFEITNGKPELEIKLNGRKVSIDRLELPNRLIGVASSIADRFPQQITSSPSQLRPLNNRYNNPFYEYLGIRTFNNMASSSGHITRMLDLLSNATINGNLNTALLNVFEFLRLRPWLSVEYRLKGYSTSLLERNKLSATYLKDFIRKLDERKAGFANKYFRALLYDP
jgi:hypothetical protein